MIGNAIVDILVVEDNDSERASIVESLQSSIPDVEVVAVHNGVEALNFLFSRNIWSGRVGADPVRSKNSNDDQVLVEYRLEIGILNKSRSCVIQSCTVLVCFGREKSTIGGLVDRLSEWLT